MKIFVTGATGFIGSNFINYLLKKKVDFVAHRRSEKSLPSIDLVEDPEWCTKGLDELEEKDFQGIDVIVHLAAHSMKPPYEALADCLYWNTLVPAKIFTIAHQVGVKKFVIAGSCSEYGKSGERYDFIPTSAPLEPTVTYSASKAAASISFCQFAREKKVDLSIYRIFQVFGEGESETRLWPSLRRSAMNGEDFPMTHGEQVRDFVPVEKVVEVLFNECLTENEEGEPIVKNLGTGQPQSVLEFSQHWWSHWNASGKLLVGKLPYRAQEVMRYVPEI